MFEREIERGATWLDEVSPGWEFKIDFAALEMRQACQCILGQVFKNEEVWVDYIEYAPVTAGYDFGIVLGTGDEGMDSYDRHRWAVNHGFNVDNGLTAYGECGFAQLEKEWTEFVKDRIDEGVVL